MFAPAILKPKADSHYPHTMETPSQFVIVRGCMPPAKQGVALTPDGQR